MQVEDIQWLDTAIHALLYTWSVASDDTQGSRNPSTELYHSRVHARDRQVLEKMFRAQPTAVFGSLVRLWWSDSDDIRDTAVFQAVDHLTASAQKVVELVGADLKGKGDHR